MIQQLSPARWLADARANGEGVRVAVLDSGIDRECLENKHKITIPTVNCVSVRGTTVSPNESTYSSTHGTTVADILLTLAPRITLFSADVFGPQGSCEVETIVAAIRHAMDVWNVKIINLSLGVAEQKLQQLPRRQLLHRAIEEAYYRDVLVFAAAHNDHPLTRSYPAAFAPSLISVDKGHFAEPLQYAYRLREQIEFQAYGRGYLGPFSREPATSWATPHLAGISARLLALKPNMKPFELKAFLYWMSQSERELPS